MKQQLVVFMVAGTLSGIITAFILTRHESKPAAGAAAVPVAKPPIGSVPSPTGAPQQRVAFKFPDGSSLTWTSGVGGMVKFTNATAVMPMWRFLQSPTWEEASGPRHFHSAYLRTARLPFGGPPSPRMRTDLQAIPPAGDVPAMQSYIQGMRSRSVDTYDFRTRLPVIDFKDYKK